MKGITEIILTDAKSGREERIVDENMFTNALNSIFKQAPYYFNNSLLQNNIVISKELLTPPDKKALGGLLLFPDPINEDANTLYAPADNKPTGIASNNAYSGEDTRRGSFNEVESGPVTNGYKFVWDFTTSQANGRISCVSLTSAKGGEGYLDGNTVLLHSNNMSAVANMVGLAHMNDGNITDADTDKNPRGIAIGADASGVYFYRYSTQSIHRFSAPKNELSLLFDSTTYERLFTPSSNAGSWSVTEGHVYCVRTNGNSSGNATVIIDKYSAVDGWSLTSETITVAAQLKKAENTRTVAINNGYLYMQGYDGHSVYKINLGTLADVTKIETGSDGRNLYSFGSSVTCKDFLIESDNTVHITGTIANPMALVGCWAVLAQGFYSTGAQLIFGASIFTPYLATINNITPVIKDNSKNMKVIYTVYYS